LLLLGGNLVLLNQFPGARVEPLAVYAELRHVGFPLRHGRRGDPLQLGTLATQLAGRPMTVGCRVEGAAQTVVPSAAQGKKDELKAAVMAEPAVQALLDVFPADIRDVEEVQE